MLSFAQVRHCLHRCFIWLENNLPAELKNFVLHAEPPGGLWSNQSCCHILHSLGSLGFLFALTRNLNYYWLWTTIWFSNWQKLLRPFCTSLAVIGILVRQSLLKLCKKVATTSVSQEKYSPAQPVQNVTITSVASKTTLELSMENKVSIPANIHKWNKTAM